MEIDTSALGELYELLQPCSTQMQALLRRLVSDNRMRAHSSRCHVLQAGKICHNMLRLYASGIASAAFVGSCNWDDRGRRTCFWMMTCVPRDMSTHVVRVSVQNIAWNQLTSCGSATGCGDNIILEFPWYEAFARHDDAYRYLSDSVCLDLETGLQYYLAHGLFQSSTWCRLTFAV